NDGGEGGVTVVLWWLSWDSSQRRGWRVEVTAAAAAMAAGGGMAARGGAWVWGSGRSEWGKYFWYWPEKSPEKFSGGRRAAAVVAEGWPAVAGQIEGEREQSVSVCVIRDGNEI
ncbi:hypothetical protein Tco_0276564, partial [Tanacetum coccineum]